MFNISQYKATTIAKENFLKNLLATKKEKYTYINFTQCQTTLVTKNDKNYWYVKIVDSDISWADENTLYDGCLTDDELEKLQGYVDAQTGEFKTEI